MCQGPGVGVWTYRVSLGHCEPGRERSGDARVTSEAAWTGCTGPATGLWSQPRTHMGGTRKV